MSATVTVRVDYAAPGGGAWTDFSGDVLQPGGMAVAYGIDGGGPTDCFASTGETKFVVRNDAGNTAGLQGAYSPLHVNARSGWTYGSQIRVTLFSSGDAAAAVTSITRASSTATVTTTAPHGRATGDWVLVAGAVQTEYNGVFQITVTGGSTFTYTVSGTPATPATGTKTWRLGYVVHRGKAWTIDPMPNLHGEQRVNVVSSDGVADLMDADVRAVAFQVSKTEAQLQTTILNSLQTDSQPIARSLDTGVDTFAAAFYDLAEGDKAAAILADIVQSAYGLAYVKGDGTYTYKNRRTLSAQASAYTFSLDTMHGLSAPSTIDSVYNRIRVTVHPVTTDAAATTVVWSKSGAAIHVGVGSTVEIWGEFFDPDNTVKLIGATAAVDGVLTATDYTANALSDGTGTNITTSVQVTATAYASSVKFVIVNNGTTAAFVTMLQLRAKAVRDNGPRTAEGYVAKTYDKALPIDMRYQNDDAVGQSIADYIAAQYAALEDQAAGIEFLANDSPAFMTQALAREPGDTITVSETMTGLSGVEISIRRKELTIAPNGTLRCRFGTAPAPPFPMWQVGIVGVSELGTTAQLGV